MKNSIQSGFALIVTTIILSGFAGFDVAAQDQGAVSGSITYQTFYDELSPYGTWIDYPDYGHVWSPGLEGDFRPYATNGYWAYSDEGWAWASNYSWGWAPFHYGRWIYDDMYGWLWVPGYDWSPAWVTWGSVDNYYAWAPLMPGVNVGMQFSSWRPHAFYWNVCSRDHIYDRNLVNVIQRPEQVSTIANRITVINNFNNTRVHNLFYSKGPDVHEVEKYTNHKIEPVKMREVNKINRVKQEGNEMRIYRPQVQNPQPRQFRRVDNVSARPIQSEQDKPIGPRKEQMDNINRLPVHQAPAGSFGGGNRGGRKHR